jgi:hypothetical protein
MAYTDATDARYDAHAAEWDLIRKMLTGEGARSVLERGSYEAVRAYRKRKETADWRPYTRDLISRLTGELFSRSGEVSREDVAASEEYRASVGPDGESYEVLLVELMETLVAYHEVWAVMDPAQGLLICEPQAIRRSTEDAVIRMGTWTTGGDVATDEESQDAWVVYYPDHYETYVKTEEGGEREEKLVDEGRYREEGDSWAFTRNGRPAPPAVQITLPWKVRFGLSVAKAHRALYRLESKYDAALTNSLGGLLQIATGGDDDIASAIKNALKSGDVAVPYDKDAGEHKPINVGTEGLGPGREALKRKRQELYRSAYQSLDQASTQMSATEAEQRQRSGPAAALSVLAETVQSAEELILPLMAQAEDYRNAGAELAPVVDWPTDYADAFDDEDEQLAKDIFGPRLPVPTDAAVQVVMDRLQSAGMEPDEDAVRQAVEDRRAAQAQDPTDSTYV